MNTHISLPKLLYIKCPESGVFDEVLLSFIFHGILLCTDSCFMPVMGSPTSFSLINPFLKKRKLGCVKNTGNGGKRGSQNKVFWKGRLTVYQENRKKASIIYILKILREYSWSSRIQTAWIANSVKARIISTGFCSVPSFTNNRKKQTAQAKAKHQSRRCDPWKCICTREDNVYVSLLFFRTLGDRPVSAGRRMV